MTTASQATHADPVDVQRREGTPTAFCWRGRVYLVRGVLAHWLETGPWRQSASVRALLDASTSTSTSTAAPAGPSDAAPTGSPSASPDSGGRHAAGPTAAGPAPTAAASAVVDPAAAWAAAGAAGAGSTGPATSVPGHAPGVATVPAARVAAGAAAGGSGVGVGLVVGAAVSGGGEPAPAERSAGSPSGASSAEETQVGQREFWQVEAAAGRHAAPGVYELCADWTAGAPGAWSVTVVDGRDQRVARGSP